MSNSTLDARRYTLKIGWLYPELMSTYGDRGNIIVLQKRLEWRGVQASVKRLDVGFSTADLESCDLLFMGGGEDQQQAIVAKDVEKKKEVLVKLIENGTPGLYICGAYQFLGKYYKSADGTIIDCLNIFDIHTENPGIKYPRLIGNIIVELSKDVILALLRASSTRPESDPGVTSLPRMTELVGFENHGGRTYLGSNLSPLGTVVKGFGNNGQDATEGAVYKNSFGTYLHGPILPKNPQFADYLLSLALEKKYGEKVELPLLDDQMELDAHNAIVSRLKK
jgi:lipid II isoglutaminyl synthase (glutamine-hydrolysing)